MKRTADRVTAWCRSPSGRAAFTIAALGLSLLWAYWTTLATMADRWAHDPQYSHGFLVPVFALVVLWFRRDGFPGGKLVPSWGGLLLLLPGVALRFCGAYFYFPSIEDFSLLPSLAGLCVLLGGWAALRWAWPAVAFLAFMLPLPYQVELFLAHPLRHVATVASTYLLQLFGFPALSEGNIILIEDLRLGVIDACSGLGMLVTFFALSTAVAFIVQRGKFDRAVLVVSAVPIALAANILRITATATAHATAGASVGAALHDLSGWLMMPLALGLLWLELLFLDNLFVRAAPRRPLPVDLPGTAMMPAPGKRGEPLSVAGGSRD
jgi:exosortase